MGKKTVRGHDIANRFVYSLSNKKYRQPYYGWRYFLLLFYYPLDR